MQKRGFSKQAYNNADDNMKNTHKSSWIKANAGSGKTTRLTRRVLALMLEGVPPERIVCITYTKAAANEMRERILRRLRELLILDDDACRAAIADYLEKPATETHLARARVLFADMLDSPYGGLQLTTIHGFCQNLLRRFPLEAELSPHFTVLEDKAAEEAQSRAKYAVLQLDSATPELEQALSLLGERGGEWHFDALANDIIAKRRSWQVVVSNLTPELLRARIYAAHGADVGASEKTLAAACQVSAAQMATLRTALPELFGHQTKKYQDWGVLLAAWLEQAVAIDTSSLRGAYAAPSTTTTSDAPKQSISSSLSTQMDCFGLSPFEDAESRSHGLAMTRLHFQGLAKPATLQPLCDAFLRENGAPKARLFNKKDFPEGSPLRVALEGLIEQLSRYYTQAIALAIAEESAAIALIAQTLLRMYALEKAERQELDYDDLILRTLQLVSSPQTLGWVMQKLDHRIDHLLIDEAQDNSREQWKLAHLLVEELMSNAGGVSASGMPRSLLVVGDEKQSIYSFQGAAPEQFATYHKHFEQLLKHGAAPLALETLAKSYRSAEAVLRFVDTVCALPEVASAIATDGVPEKHILHHAQAAGVVKLYPPIARAERESAPPLTMPVEYRVTRSAAQLLAEEIARTVHGWLNVEHRGLESEGRPLRAGDILILVHHRKPMVMPLLRELQKLGVAVAGIDRLTLSTHLAVRDLLALMQWVMTPTDDLALAQVLRSPLIGMSDEELRRIAHPRTGSLWAEIHIPWLAEALQRKHATPYAFLSFVLSASGKSRDFARRFGNEVQEVLDELLAQAAAMPADMAQTLAMFHEWMTKSTRQIKRELEGEGVNAVRIMTVHGAKGLEAPVVILADTVSVPNTGRERSYFTMTSEGVVVPVMALSEMGKQSPLLDAAKDLKKRQLLEEYYRLLYVALTRAKYELHLFGSANEKGEVKPASWFAKMREAMLKLVPEGEGVLTYADNRPTTAHHEKLLATTQTPPLPSWAQAMASTQQAVANTLAPSRIQTGASQGYHAFAGASTRERGVRIHRILELLPPAHDAAVIDAIIRHLCPDWEEADFATTATQIKKLSELHPWLWQYPRYPEVSVAGTIERHGQKIQVSGSIDLLLDTGSERIILDYKTAMRVPANSEEVPDQYILQLKLYRELLQQIDNRTPIRCAILWTHAPSLMWLDERVDRTPFPDEKMVIQLDLAA